MVSEKNVGDKIFFLFEICGLEYENKKTTQNCEDYCRAHPDSCSAEIREKAVYVPGAPILPKKK